MRKKISRDGRILLAQKVGIDQPYQHEIIVDESPRIIINKSCSIGVSFAVAFKKLLDAIEEPNSYKLFVSQRRENVNLIIEYVCKFHQDLMNIIDDIPAIITNSKNDGIKLANGSHFMSFPADPNAMRSYHGDVTLDEFAFMPDDVGLFRTSRSRLKPGKKQFIIISSPNEEGGKFYHLWKREYEEKFGRWKCYYLPYTVCNIPGFQDDINEERKEAVEDGTLEDWEQEYTGKFINKDSLIFSWDLIQACLCPDAGVPDCKPVFGGLDFAQKIDKSVLRVLGKIDERIIVQDNPLKMSGGYTEQLEGVKGHVREMGLSKLFGDRTGVGRRLVEELIESDIGYLCEGITFTNEWKESAIMYLYSLMTAHKIMFPDDKTLLDQIHKLKREKTVGGNWRYNHKRGHHDDEVWALCLALQGYIKSNENDNAEDVILSGRQNMLMSRRKIMNLRDEIGRIR